MNPSIIVRQHDQGASISCLSLHSLHEELTMSTAKWQNLPIKSENVFSLILIHPPPGKIHFDITKLLNRKHYCTPG